MEVKICRCNVFFFFFQRQNLHDRKIGRASEVCQARNLSRPRNEKKPIDLESSEVCQDFDLSTKIIKVNSNIFIEHFQDELADKFLEVDKFLCCSELANITSVHEKSSRSEKRNFRPVRIPPNLSQIFEKCV